MSRFRTWRSPWTEGEGELAIKERRSVEKMKTAGVESGVHAMRTPPAADARSDAEAAKLIAAKRLIDAAAVISRVAHVIGAVKPIRGVLMICGVRLKKTQRWGDACSAVDQSVQRAVLLGSVLRSSVTLRVDVVCLQWFAAENLLERSARLRLKRSAQRLGVKRCLASSPVSLLPVVHCARSTMLVLQGNTVALGDAARLVVASMKRSRPVQTI